MDFWKWFWPQMFHMVVILEIVEYSTQFAQKYQYLQYLVDTEFQGLFF